MAPVMEPCLYCIAVFIGEKPCGATLRFFAQEIPWVCTREEGHDDMHVACATNSHSHFCWMPGSIDRSVTCSLSGTA